MVLVVIYHTSCARIDFDRKLRPQHPFHARNTHFSWTVTVPGPLMSVYIAHAHGRNSNRRVRPLRGEITRACRELSLSSDLSVSMNRGIAFDRTWPLRRTGPPITGACWRVLSS